MEVEIDLSPDNDLVISKRLSDKLVTLIIHEDSTLALSVIYTNSSDQDTLYFAFDAREKAGILEMFKTECASDELPDSTPADTPTVLDQGRAAEPPAAGAGI